MTMFAHRMVAVVLVLLIWTGHATDARAASDDPPWRQHLSCDPAIQKYRGMEFCTGATGQVYVTVVDLRSPDVRLEYVITEGRNKSGQIGECQDVNIPQYGPVRGGCADPNNSAYYPVMTLDKAVELAKNRDVNAAVVIDSDYGAGTQGNPGQFRGHGPEGLTVVRGDRLDGPANGDTDNNAVNRPWLAVGSKTPLQVELGQLTHDDGGKADWIYTGVGGGPWLIRSGAIQTEDIVSCRNTPGSCYDGAVQTAVGLSKDRRWLFLVIDARKGKLLDMAQFMNEQLTAADAIKFDGGGSSQLWYAGQIISHGDGRELSQYLAVIAPPGSGIEKDPPPLSLGEQVKALIERVLQAITRKFEELGQKLSDWIQRELERQVQELVDQVCGGSALLPTGVAVGLLVRRCRRR